MFLRSIFKLLLTAAFFNSLVLTSLFCSHALSYLSCSLPLLFTVAASFSMLCCWHCSPCTSTSLPSPPCNLGHCFLLPVCLIFFPFSYLLFLCQSSFPRPPLSIILFSYNSFPLSLVRWYPHVEYWYFGPYSTILVQPPTNINTRLRFSTLGTFMNLMRKRS